MPRNIWQLVEAYWIVQAIAAVALVTVVIIVEWLDL